MHCVMAHALTTATLTKRTGKESFEKIMDKTTGILSESFVNKIDDIPVIRLVKIRRGNIIKLFRKLGSG